LFVGYTQNLENSFAGRVRLVVMIKNIIYIFVLE
jgi:hypothetical protein